MIVVQPVSRTVPLAGDSKRARTPATSTANIESAPTSQWPPTPMRSARLSFQAALPYAPASPHDPKTWTLVPSSAYAPNVSLRKLRPLTCDSPLLR